jgi:hypothetical protein
LLGPKKIIIKFHLFSNPKIPEYRDMTFTLIISTQDKNCLILAKTVLEVKPELDLA